MEYSRYHYLFETETRLIIWLPVILVKEKQHYYVREGLGPRATLTNVLTVMTTKTAVWWGWWTGKTYERNLLHPLSYGIHSST
jgi:hypothetical protein